jgi:pimeloyl-ACP methyl ester carboxylesterase
VQFPASTTHRRCDNQDVRSLPSRVGAWREAGQLLAVAGNDVFVTDHSGPAGPPLVVLHGFPGSSFDWCDVIPALAVKRRVIALDLIGFGLSAKPATQYSLFTQADLVEAVLSALGVSSCVLVAHDMGDTVAAELLHRYNAGLLPFTIEQVILTNGSIFIDMARLTRGQRLALALPNAPLPVPLPGIFLRRSLAESFASASPPPAAALDAMVRLIQHGGGARLLPVQIRYIEERRRHQERWTSALVEYPGSLTAVWGELDPIAIVDMPRRLHQLRPATRVITWPDTGHWPSIEQPARLAATILAETS